MKEHRKTRYRIVWRYASGGVANIGAASKKFATQVMKRMQKGAATKQVVVYDRETQSRTFDGANWVPLDSETLLFDPSNTAASKR